jgi:adenylate cyclase
MAPESFKRKLTAILSADVKGYSRLMGENEAETVKTITAYRKIMEELIRQHRGRVVDSPGDNILAEFASVVDAVQCAVAAQNELKARNAELPENRRMEFRIGVNLGDVIEEEKRIYGDGVNIAARLESLADPSGICISKTAFDQIETKLPFGYEYLGEQTVKNIAKPVGAYRVLMDPRVTVAGAEEKKAPAPLWLRKGVLAGAMAVLIVILGAAVWNFYLRAPKIEPASREKITAASSEKPSATVPASPAPSKAPALKEKATPPSPEKPPRVATATPPVEKADPKKMAFPIPDKPSIAVLPFVNMSGDPKEEFFSDGLTEDIITALSKHPGLFVIARNSSSTYKGKPVKVQQVAEDLGVRYVLEGSIQRSGDRVRITGQLIDAIKGHHIWSERYDREMKDIFALQDKIALEILKALDVKLSRGEGGGLYGKGTNNLEAYLKVLQARDLLNQWNREGNVRARQTAEEAISLDPQYPMAYSVLATATMMDVWLQISKSPKESLMKAIELYQKTISLDDTNAAAHAFLGFLYVQTGEHEKGIAQSERALVIAPNSDTAHSLFAQVLNFSGRHEEALAHNEKAFRLNPVGPPSFFYVHAAHTYMLTGKFSEGVKISKEGLSRYPNNTGLLVRLAMIYAAWGRDEEARNSGRGLLHIDSKFSAQRFARSVPFKDPAQAAQALELMRKAGLPD